VANEQNSHLLNQSFLRNLKNIMKESGLLTIVTDNLPYGKSLCNICHEAGFQSTCSVDQQVEDEESVEGFGVDVLATVGNVQLLEGMPGPESGYTKGTESYFDRLWQRGKRSRRFHLSVVKIESVTKMTNDEMKKQKKKQKKKRKKEKYQYATEVETPWHRDQSY
jgi:hypothetical protein